MDIYPTLTIGFLYYQQFPVTFIKDLYDTIYQEKLYDRFSGVVFIGNELARAFMLNMAALKEYENKSMAEFKHLFKDITIIKFGKNNESFLDVNYELRFNTILESHKMEIKNKPFQSFTRTPSPGEAIIRLASKYRPMPSLKKIRALQIQRERNDVTQTITQRRPLILENIHIYSKNRNTTHKIIIDINLLVRSHDDSRHWYNFFSKDIKRLAGFILYSNQKTLSVNR